MKTLNSQVVELLEGELGFVLSEAEKKAEALDPENASAFVELLTQIQGTCALVGLESLRRLADELVVTLNKDSLAKIVDPEQLKERVHNSLVAASKLVKAVIDTRTDNTCALLPEMSALRRLRGETPLYEYHCLKQVNWPALDKAVATNPLGGEQQEDVKRLLHLYQFGLLDVIRNNNRKKAFVILFRVGKRLEDIAELGAEKDYWWVVSQVIRALAEGRLEMQSERLRLLAAVEKQIRLLAADDPASGRSPYPEGLWRAFVSLVALLDSLDEADQARREEIGVPDLGFGEQDIASIRKYIAEDVGGEGKAFRSLKDLIWNTRFLLDVSEDGDNGAGAISVIEVKEAFTKMANLWGQTGFKGLSRRFKLLATRLSDGDTDDTLSQEMMVEMIDAILQSECALIEFDYMEPSRIQAKEWESRPINEILQHSLLKTAQIAVLDEAAVRLDQIKELLTEVSSGYAGEDALPELESALEAIAAGARIIQYARLAALTDRSLKFIKEVVFAGQTSQLMENFWEVFADGISCLEYYIDNCKAGYLEDEAPLDTADKCLTSLGV
ncbi:MAG TPA: hypothetical protein DCF62_02780 [Porticoccaceae bacterium]|nr:hypothetical protein [Porticoccaceae bacterium]HCO60055.1 hypothetical protein [Porticoccaceae bacterium]